MIFRREKDDLSANVILENATWQVRTKQNKQGQLHNELIKRKKEKSNSKNQKTQKSWILWQDKSS